jgi:hypothetical protein
LDSDIGMFCIEKSSLANQNHLKIYRLISRPVDFRIRLGEILEGYFAQIEIWDFLPATHFTSANLHKSTFELVDKPSSTGRILLFKFRK